MTTINWTISSLERDVATGYVRVAHWQATGTDGDFSGSVYSACSFEGELTIPYESLTEEVVIGWVKEAIGAETVAAHEANVAAQIAAAKAPVTATGLPWGE